MSQILSDISLYFIPGIMTIIVAHGAYKRAPVYELFIEGCRDGLKSAMDILPFLIGIFLAIELLTQSGALEILNRLTSPFFSVIGIPEELGPFLIMRPVSGSGSLVLLESLVESYGADSFISRSAAVMMGSSETVLYAIAVYFGATSVKNLRHTAKAGFIGYFVGIGTSLMLCKIM